MVRASTLRPAGMNESMAGNCPPYTMSDLDPSKGDETIFESRPQEVIHVLNIYLVGLLVLVLFILDEIVRESQ